MEEQEKSLDQKFSEYLYKADKNLIISDVAQSIAKKYNIIYYNGLLYLKINNKYISNKNEISLLINNDVTLTKKQYTELIYQLQFYAKRINESVNKIRLNNGILTLTEENKYEVIADNGDFCPFNLDVNYSEKEQDNIVIKFLNDVSCNNKDIYEILIEMIGCILITEPKAQFLFFIYGNKGRNGKSTFTSMLSNFIGKELTSNIGINGFKDGTVLSTLSGKLLNICDDADYEKIYLERSQILKSLASGQEINCRAIYSMPVEFKNTATIIGTSNTMPEFADKSGGMRRRLIILEFNMSITKENNDPDILKKLSTSSAKSTILNLAIKGMNNVAKNNYFISENETLKTTLEDYYCSTDTVKDFIDNCKCQIEDIKVAQVYDAYCTFCDETICKEKENKNIFGMRMKHYGYYSKPISKKGIKTYRVYKQKNN
jgi:putative DNA primase/helicase